MRYFQLLKFLSVTNFDILLPIENKERQFEQIKIIFNHDLWKPKLIIRRNMLFLEISLFLINEKGIGDKDRWMMFSFFLKVTRPWSIGLWNPQITNLPLNKQIGRPWVRGVFWIIGTTKVKRSTLIDQIVRDKTIISVYLH